jgi:IS30 family transposase
LKQKDLDIILDILNNAPRKILGFKTLQELFYAIYPLHFYERCARKLTPT